MSTLESKLAKLSESLDGGREDAIQEVSVMQKMFKDAKLRSSLSKQPAMVKLIAFLRKREQAYTLVLANKEDLEEVKRRAYFERRKECRFVLSFFDSAETTLETLEQQVDFQLTPESE